MFFTDSRVDLAIYDFNSGEPIYFATDLKEVVFVSGSKAIPLSAAKTMPFQLVQNPQLETIQVQFNGLDHFVLPKLFPLEQQAAMQTFTDFVLGVDLQPIKIPKAKRIIEVGYFDKNGNKVALEYSIDYDLNQDGEIVFSSALGRKVYVVAEFETDNVSYDLIEKPHVNPAFRLQIKQQIQYQDKTREVLTITVPKVNITEGAQYFLANLGKTQSDMPLNFVVLHDCDEKTTFRFWEE